MRAKKLILCLSLVGAIITLSSGCGRAIKEGVGVARGAKGLYAPIETSGLQTSAYPLAQYQCFELGEITDDFGGKVPRALWTYLSDEFQHQLSEKELPNNPAGRTLLVRGRILHYEDASTLGHALGPLEQVVARIELVDKSTGQVLGTANCVGRTKESVNVGVAKKAQGLAKAIVAWLANRYGPEDRD